MQVRRTFSASRAWRPTVGAGLTRTLGSATYTMRYFSRKCGLRREQSSHKAAQPRAHRAAFSSAGSGRAELVHCEIVSAKRACTAQPIRKRFAGGTVGPCGTLGHFGSSICHSPPPARRWPRSAACRMAGANFGCSRPVRFARLVMPRAISGATPCCLANRGAALPNTSLNRSSNGRPPGPGRGYGVHFHQPGPGVLPLLPG